MKKKGIAIFCAMLVAATVLSFAGCSKSEDNASSVASVESQLESATESSEVAEDDGLDKNEQMETKIESLVNGAVTINYPVLSKMDVAEKQEKVNALLLQDAKTCMANHFPSGNTSAGIMDVTEGYHSKEYLSFVSIGSFVSEGEKDPKMVFYVTNLNLQTGERFQTPVRENAAVLAKTIHSGEGYSVLTPSDDLREQQKAYLMGLSEADLIALLSGCDYTAEDSKPKCFSYPLGEGNYAIYLPVSSSLTGYATVQVRMDAPAASPSSVASTSSTASETN
ncbi:MAG: hypothetical protein HFJ84_01635 [Clostridiales bacterium]|jgi:hypothetical protein|nr:hypothetical protein [Clostridiales bacterium]